MPKTTMNEDNFLPHTKNHIGFSWKIGRMKSVTVTEAVNKASDNHFWLCVSPLDAPHDFASPLLGNGVHHDAPMVASALHADADPSSRWTP